MTSKSHNENIFSENVFGKGFKKIKIKSVAYSSQGSHAED